MADKDMDAKQLEAKVHDLATAMDHVKNDQATRDDVVVEMKQAAFSRLELLAKDLKSVFDDVPEDNEQFEFALTKGEAARLWVDMTSFVRMGRDKRVYEFVKDTRMGRTIIAKSEDRQRVGEAVTSYVAERILERERAIEGDWLSLKNYSFEEDEAAETSDNFTIDKSEKQSGYGWKYVGWTLLGLCLGAGAMLAWAWFGDIPAFISQIQ
ncbi:MAG: hypothetical protein AB8B49_04535 [Nitratireductor sp.]